MRKLSCFLLCILLVGSSFAQKAKETESERLGSHAFSISTNKPDSALILSERGLDIAKQQSDKKGMAICLNAKAMALYRLGKNDSAEITFLAAFNSFKSQHNKHDQGRTLINLSMMYTEEENYEKAMKCVVEARGYMEAVNDETGKAYAEKMIGILYRQQGNGLEAIKHLQSALKDFKRIGQLEYAADAQSSIGTVYKIMNQTDSASFYYGCAFTYYNTTHNQSGIAYMSENIADVYFNKANNQNNHWLDSSLHYYNLAYELFQKLQNDQNIAYEKMMIGNVLIAKGDPTSARKYLKEALQTFEESKSYNYAVKTLDYLNLLEGNSKNYKDAYEYSRREMIYKDTLAANNRKDVMAAMLAKYEVDNRDRTIALLNAQKKLTAQELHHRRIMDFIYLTLAFIAIGIGFVLFNFYNVRQHLKELKMRNQIASDLHDEVGSSLSSILLLSKMALLDKNDDIIKQQLLTTIRENTSEVIERMSDIVWATDPKFDESESLQLHMENYVEQLKQNQDLHITANFSEEIEHLQFTMQVRKNIYLIFKEAINNVLKHAEATEITILLSQKGSMLHLQICDNGKGFNMKQTQEGLGLHTMRQRAESMKGMLEITSNKPTGCCIKMQIPIKKYQAKKLKRLYHGNEA